MIFLCVNSVLIINQEEKLDIYRVKNSVVNKLKPILCTYIDYYIFKVRLDLKTSMIFSSLINIILFFSFLVCNTESQLTYFYYCSIRRERFIFISNSIEKLFVGELAEFYYQPSIYSSDDGTDSAKRWPIDMRDANLEE